jgi:hypothetical protein
MTEEYQKQEKGNVQTATKKEKASEVKNWQEGIHRDSRSQNAKQFSRLFSYSNQRNAGVSKFSMQ